MMKLILPVGMLLLSVGMLLAGNGLQSTLLPMRAQIEEFAAFDIGLMGSAYYLGFVAGCLAAPGLVRRVGHIRTFAALVSLASALTLAHALFIHPVFWWLLRILAGASFAGLYLVIESWLNERADNKSRGLIMSAYQIVVLTGITIGQLLIIAFPPAELGVFLLTSLVISLAAIPVALSISPAPDPPGNAKLRLTKLYRTSPAGIMACIAVGITQGAFWTLGPTFALDIGMSSSGAAIFMSIAVISGALFQYPFGKLSDSMDRRKVLIGLCAGTSVFSVLLMFWPTPSQLALFALVFGFGAFAMSVYAVAVSYVFDFAAPDARVETSSGILLLNAAGSVVGPMVAAAFDEYFPQKGLFLLTTITYACLIGFILYRSTQRAAAKTRDNTPHFADTPGPVAPLRRWWGLKSVRK